MPAPFFSIIIPVYNDEKNLPRCLDSVLSQTFNDFELLLIDDGSTDNCPSICNEYAKKDIHIRLFLKNNEGISKTRQFGIDNAAGSYVVFVDSDDWIEINMLTEVKQNLKKNNTDIIFMDFIKENATGKKQNIVQKLSALDTETVIRLVLERKLLSCLWNVIINREFYIKMGINFTEGINYGEDTLFILELILNNANVGYLRGTHYHHTYNQDSFTRKNQKQRYIERVDFLDKIDPLLEKYNRNDLSKHNFLPFYDKFEMLCSGLFSKKEYQKLFSLSFNSYYLKHVDFKRYSLLVLAETWFYPIVKYIAIFIRRFR
jgi:glycosyltransferase involved in cell wall biosynthesis